MIEFLALWLASLLRAGSGKENEVGSETTLHLPGCSALHEVMQSSFKNEYFQPPGAGRDALNAIDNNNI